MSKPSAGASGKHSYQNSKAEEYARWRRRDHANIEAVQNLLIASVAGETGVEMPPNARHLVSALQGAHGGGEVAYEPFQRDYLAVGRQLQFTGKEDAIRARVRRWIDDLCRWQRDAGVELFSVVKGGEVIGTRPDGTPIRKATTFIDNLKPLADEAVQRARMSALWKEHPGKALAAQVGWLRKELPALKPETEDKTAGGEKKTNPLPVTEYERRQEERLAKALEDTADEIERRDGDADLWLEKFERLIHKMRVSRARTAPARNSWIMPDDEDGETPAESSASGNAYTCDKFDPPAAPAEGGLGDKNVTQAEAENPENTPSVLEWALAFASQGVPAFPLQPRGKAPSAGSSRTA